MSHRQSEYEALIREFCDAAGILEWAQLIETRHIAVGDRLVGLIPVLDGDVATVSVCIELGQTYPDRDAEIYECLLEANLEAGLGMRGHYALHGASKHAVYCMCLGLDGLTGTELARILDEELQVRRLALPEMLNG